MKFYKILTILFCLSLSHNSFSGLSDEFEKLSDVDIELNSSSSEMAACSGLNFLNGINKENYNLLLKKIHDSIHPDYRRDLKDLPKFEELENGDSLTANAFAKAIEHLEKNSISCLKNNLKDMDKAFNMAAESYYSSYGSWAKYVAPEWEKNTKFYLDNTFGKLKSGELNPVVYGVGATFSAIGAVVWNGVALGCSVSVGSYKYAIDTYGNCLEDIKTDLYKTFSSLKSDYAGYFNNAIQGYLQTALKEVFLLMFLNDRGLCRYYGVKFSEHFFDFLEKTQAAVGAGKWSIKNPTLADKVNVVKNFKDKFNEAKLELTSGASRSLQYSLKSAVTVSQIPNVYYYYNLGDVTLIKAIMDPTDNYKKYKELCNCTPNGLIR